MTSTVKGEAVKYERENEGEMRGQLECDTDGESQSILVTQKEELAVNNWQGETIHPRRRAGNVLIGSFGKVSLHRDYCWSLIEMVMIA